MADAARRAFPEATITCEGRAWRIRPGEALTLGRAGTCDVLLPSADVSPLHARICWAPGDALPRIADAGSAIGVLVDGILAARPLGLRDGATVRVGGWELAVAFGDGTGTRARPLAVPLTVAAVRLAEEVAQAPCAPTPEHGWLREDLTLDDLLRELERIRYTGALEVGIGLGRKTRLELEGGLLCGARRGDEQGLAVLRDLVARTRSGTFFRRCPRGGAEVTRFPVGLHPRQVLAAAKKSGG